MSSTPVTVRTMKRKNDRPPRHTVYRRRKADLATSTGCRCSSRLPTTVCARVRSVFGKGVLNTDRKTSV
jgi:hypothetical protein